MEELQIVKPLPSEKISHSLNSVSEEASVSEKAREPQDVNPLPSDKISNALNSALAEASVKEETREPQDFNAFPSEKINKALNSMSEEMSVSEEARGTQDVNSLPSEKICNALNSLSEEPSVTEETRRFVLDNLPKKKKKKKNKKKKNGEGQEPQEVNPLSSEKICNTLNSVSEETFVGEEAREPQNVNILNFTFNAPYVLNSLSEEASVSKDARESHALNPLPSEKINSALLSMSEEARAYTTSVFSQCNFGDVAMSDIKDESAPALAQVKVKVPDFSEVSISSWFHILESQFHLAKITSEQDRFYYTLSNLPLKLVDCISPDKLQAKNYSSLKSFIIYLCTCNKMEMFKELLSEYVFQGVPSSNLHNMINLAKKFNVECDIVRHCFIKTLPISVQTIVSKQTSLSLEQLATLADDLISFFNIFSNQTNFRAASNPILYKPQSFYNNQKLKICDDHIYYADRAGCCKPWCKWPNKQGLQIRSSSRDSTAPY